VTTLTTRLPDAPVIRVPFLADDVHDLAGLIEVGRWLFDDAGDGAGDDAGEDGAGNAGEDGGGDAGEDLAGSAGEDLAGSAGA
jgi:hypothetical protein